MKFAYFKLDSVITDKYVSMYKADIKPERSRILCQLQTATGAVGFKITDKGYNEVIDAVYFNHVPYGAAWEIMESGLFFDGYLLVSAVPDTEYASGRDVAEELERACQKLKNYPCFEHWLCEKLGVISKGMFMFGGYSAWKLVFSRDGSHILFRVPLDHEGKVRESIPVDCTRIKHSEYVALTEE
ncbi:DUF5420 family protein [Salmonella enterica]|uniref:Uncharacterized protein n=1 Tax=Salmonella enterica TaxID=28901 RepID=A0A743P8I8_SALER|nr:hypothetical protein [Salmonella enterica subsp. enterica serovar Braenderup]ELU6656798.1 DUF5420 family protein [Salmonella enterica]EEH1390571.1 hypothetical protein [Salmonella enterica subsp. enterica serovar Braenderup]ELW1285667.1 DUF5420 family protein [Salmonella enterica]EMB4356942.1 DUF5420 family protein [Salmonella enterica]